MTTEKALRKILEATQRNGNRDIHFLNADEFKEMFAQVFYPRLYKRNPSKAITKSMIDIEVCEKLKYLNYDKNARNLEQYISLTKEGSQRIESKADSIRNVLVKALIALGGAAGTVACSFIIQLIQTHL